MRIDSMNLINKITAVTVMLVQLLLLLPLNPGLEGSAYSEPDGISDNMNSLAIMNADENMWTQNYQETRTLQVNQTPVLYLNSKSDMDAIKDESIRDYLINNVLFENSPFIIYKLPLALQTSDG
ncbi:MAG: hypothetical protein AB7T22_15690 [Calditrichaceae bacterium]